MFDKFLTDTVAVATAIVGLAIVAVLVSKKSSSANVITSAGNAFDNIIKTAVSPVS